MLNKPAVHDIPLSKLKKKRKIPIRKVPMYNPIFEVAARKESRMADVIHPDKDAKIIFVGSMYLDINIPLDLPKTKAPKYNELSMAASFVVIPSGPQSPYVYVIL